MAANRSIVPNHPMFSRHAQCASRFACAALGRRQSHKLRWRRIRSHISERAFSFKKW